MSGRPFRIPAVAATLIGAVLVSCGVPVEDEARAMPQEEVPFDLLDSPASTILPGETVPVRVYLRQGNELVAVQRSLPAPPTAGDALAELAVGPSAQEQAWGIASEFDESDDFGDLREGGGLIRVDLSKEIADLPRSNQLLAIAQLTMTLTELDPGAKIGLTVEGRPIDAPLPNGATTSSPVGRADYVELVANP